MLGLLPTLLTYTADCSLEKQINNRDSKTNIVFILADDMGYGDPGCYNDHSKIPTPNMDKLASEGMRFTDAHSPSAVCTPTRYGLLTGRYAWRSRMKNGVLNGYSRSLIEDGRPTVASLLKEQGYQTGCVGKWHLGFQPYDATVDKVDPVDYDQPLIPGPNQYGFDFFWGIPASLDMPPYIYVENGKPIELPTDQVEDSGHRRQNGDGFWRGGPIAPSFRHIDVLPELTKQAVRYVEQATQRDQPFFLYFPLTAPHTPWMPIPEFEGKSDAGYYGDFTMQVDWSIGQLMATLESAGVENETLIIVTSDNGSHWYQNDIEKFDHHSNYHWRGQKADIWEGGHRVPFIARWPEKIEANTVSDQTICLTDLFNTVADITASPLSAQDSFSILPALKNSDFTGSIRSSIVNHSASGIFAIRKEKWKLIEGLGSGGFSSPRSEETKPNGPKGQLYNLAQDPGELTNQYLDQPKIVQDLLGLLETQKTQGFT